MLVYQPSNVTKTYTHAATPPRLDRVNFTIDHIDSGEYHACSTYELVRYLVYRNIPVTVFVQVTSAANDYAVDKEDAGRIYRLSPRLVTLGVHPKERGHTQREQHEVHNILNHIIQSVTGRRPQVLSYHGHGAGPEPGIIYPGIRYARGVHSRIDDRDRMNTPVMPLGSVDSAFHYIKKCNAAGRSASLFVHSREVTRNSSRKRVLDTLVKEVLSRRLQAQSYWDAMRQDFRDAGTQPQPTQPTQPHQPHTPSGNSNTKYGLRLSALTAQGFRPLQADFEVREVGGDMVDMSRHKTQAQFYLPAALYQATAQVGDVRMTQQVNLISGQGLHQKFLFAA